WPVFTSLGFVMFLSWAPSGRLILEARPVVLHYAEPSLTSQPAGQRAPQVSAIEPSSAGRGSLMTLKVKGKNFAPGSTVSFSNPGIQVLDITKRKDGELSVRIQIAADAPTGTTSVYVVNPDDTEVEAQFRVTEESPVTEGQPPGAPDANGKTEPSKPEAGQKPTSSGSQSTGSGG